MTPRVFHVLPGSGWALTPRQMAGLAMHRAASPRIRERPVTLPSLSAIAFAARPSGHGGTGAPVGR